MNTKKDRVVWYLNSFIVISGLALLIGTLWTSHYVRYDLRLIIITILLVNSLHDLLYVKVSKRIKKNKKRG